MKKNVIISVASKQKSTLDKLDDISFATEGLMYKKGDMYYITYKETEVTGMEGTTTTLRTNGKILTLMRFGSVSSTLVFEKGKKHMSCYETQYGTLSMSVLAKNVSIDIDDDGGKISIEYVLELNNQDNGKSEFSMLIKTQ